MAIAATAGRSFVVFLLTTPALVAVLLLLVYMPEALNAFIVVVSAFALSGLFLGTVGRMQVRAISRVWRSRASWTHRLRATEFAASNTMSYSARRSPIPRLSSVLDLVRSRYLDSFGFSIAGREVFAANATSADSSSQSHAPDGWGVVAFALDTHVPHLYLAPRTRVWNAMAPLVAIALDQRLQLEGDFDRHFTLYAPNGYERDALYVITPDLMALLIDELPGSHVEVHRDVLTITRPQPFDFAQPQTWQQIARLIDTVGRKAVRQTHRYRDERSERAGEIGLGGRVLRGGIPIGATVSAAVSVGIVAYQISRFVN